MPGTKNKTTAIMQFAKLIMTNHDVNTNIQNALTLTYTTGVEMGVLSKMLGTEFQGYSEVKEFDVTNFIYERVAEMNPRRISNKRSLTYAGPEINTHMVGHTVKRTIAMMADENSDYMYFKRAHAEKKWIDAKIRRAFSEDDKTQARKDYDTKEAYIFLLKCYEVGFSEGYNDAEKMSWKVKDIFAMAKQIDRYKAANKNTEKHRRIPTDGICDDRDLADSIGYLKNMKEAAPNWKQFEQYFI